jgi:mono/diheme cytochrome c family protein
VAAFRRFDAKHHLPSFSFLIVAVTVFSVLAAVVIYAGVYNIGADVAHTRMVYSLVDNLRDRSIAVRARNIAVPADLNSPKRIATGAGLYAEMCSGCHLAPGMERTEISQGLYPQAPELSGPVRHTPAQQFWMIKHGVKMTAMPAWGKTHSEDLMWDMVAFVGKLPSMSPEQYKATVASAPADHDEMMKDMPNMPGKMDSSPK